MKKLILILFVSSLYACTPQDEPCSKIKDEISQKLITEDSTLELLVSNKGYCLIQPYSTKQEGDSIFFNTCSRI